jgi:hypothetical protein
VHYCIDMGNATDGSVATVSLCYPSYKPSNNRDKAQHWVRRGLTLRSYGNEDLCLTNNCLAITPENLSVKMRLAKCDNREEQRWSFGGNVLGSVVSIGSLANGDELYGVVVQVKN